MRRHLQLWCATVVATLITGCDPSETTEPEPYPDVVIDLSGIFQGRVHFRALHTWSDPHCSLVAMDHYCPATLTVSPTENATMVTVREGGWEQREWNEWEYEYQAHIAVDMQACYWAGPEACGPSVRLDSTPIAGNMLFSLETIILHGDDHPNAILGSVSSELLGIYDAYLFAYSRIPDWDGKCEGVHWLEFSGQPRHFPIQEDMPFAEKQLEGCFGRTQ